MDSIKFISNLQYIYSNISSLHLRLKLLNLSFFSSFKLTSNSNEKLGPLNIAPELISSSFDVNFERLSYLNLSRAFFVIQTSKLSCSAKLLRRYKRV